MVSLMCVLLAACAELWLFCCSLLLCAVCSFFRQYADFIVIALCKKYIKTLERFSEC